MGGSPRVYARMLRRFVAEVRSMPEKLNAMLMPPDLGGLKRQLHTLKGVAATLGALPLTSAAAEGESRLSGPDVSAWSEVMPRIVDDLCATLQATLPALAELLNVLQPEPQAEAGTPLVINDTRALQAALATLVRLLKGSDMAALNAFGDLQRDFGGGLGEPLLALDEAIGALDFERAARLCEALQAAWPDAVTT
jgi:HPt (histidine-containing phosphotransfer) domain-containing protein